MIAHVLLWSDRSGSLRHDWSARCQYVSSTPRSFPAHVQGEYSCRSVTEDPYQRLVQQDQARLDRVRELLVVHHPTLTEADKPSSSAIDSVSSVRKCDPSPRLADDIASVKLARLAARS